MKPFEQIETQLMDYLMAGESTLELAALALRTSGKRLRRVARNLQMQGLIQVRNVVSHYGKAELWWSMCRTRKAA